MFIIRWNTVCPRMFMGMVLQRTLLPWKVGISGYPSCLTLTDLYPIEPVRVGGGVVRGQRATCGCKRSDWVSTKRLVPIEDKIFLKQEGYFTPPAAPLSPEPIPVPGPSTLPEVSKEEAERQVQEVAKFFEQLGGAPAVVAFTNGDWTVSCLPSV